MDLHTISFVFGAVLVAVAILGGGFEIKEIKVPKVGRIARFFAAVIGAGFLVIGIKDFWLPKTPEPSHLVGSNLTAPTRAVPQLVEEQGVAFSVSFMLGKVEDAEERESQFSLFIDGDKKAEFLLTVDAPSQSASVTVPDPGPHKYVIDGYTTWNLTGSRKIPLHGSGEIDVDRGASFSGQADSPPTATMQYWSVILAPDTEGTGETYSTEDTIATPQPVDHQ